MIPLRVSDFSGKPSPRPLNHSNIFTINEIDEANGQHFIAMELLQGQAHWRALTGGHLW